MHWFVCRNIVEPHGMLHTGLQGSGFCFNEYIVMKIMFQFCH